MKPGFPNLWVLLNHSASKYLSENTGLGNLNSTIIITCLLTIQSSSSLLRPRANSCSFFYLNSRFMRDICIALMRINPIIGNNRSLEHYLFVHQGLLGLSLIWPCCDCYQSYVLDLDVVLLSLNICVWHDGVYVCVAYSHTIKFFSVVLWSPWWWPPGLMASNSLNWCSQGEFIFFEAHIVLIRSAIFKSPWNGISVFSTVELPRCWQGSGGCDPDRIESHSSADDYCSMLAFACIQVGIIIDAIRSSSLAVA